MKRLFLLVICVYAPHLLEEHFTRIWEDPLMAASLLPCADWSPQHALYCSFQITFALLCTMTLAFSFDGRPRNVVMAAFAVALLAESHHAIRFLISHHYNSGLVTSLPMPLVGALIAFTFFRTKEKRSCSTTSFSRWESDESRSA